MQPEQLHHEDRQTYPFLMVPRLFFTRYKPSPNASLAYLAIKFFASFQSGISKSTSIPGLAMLVGISVNRFKRGLAELVKKGAVRVQRRIQAMPGKKPVSLPNLYEIVDIQPDEKMK